MQPGPDLSHWQPPAPPMAAPLDGRFVRLEPLTQAHGPRLFDSFRGQDAVWDYLPYGPFDAQGHAAWIASVCGRSDPMFFAIKDLARDAWCGVASLMRIAPEAGSIEVGHVNFAPMLQGSPAATEAIYLLLEVGFNAGFRRFEWKCDVRNMASRRAAQRFGLSYEGIFRQAAVIKGRNRDTAWFAAIDAEWPALQDVYQTWLAPANFDAQGRQKRRLSDLTRPLLAMRDPG